MSDAKENVARVERGFNTPHTVARRRTCLQDENHCFVGDCDDTSIARRSKKNDSMSQLCFDNVERLSQRMVVLAWFKADCHHCQQKGELSKV